jgi:hypothetical protein
MEASAPTEVSRQAQRHRSGGRRCKEMAMDGASVGAGGAGELGRRTAAAA